MLMELKFEIVRKCGSQWQFSKVVEMHESAVSHVITGRRKLSKEQAKKWQKVLKCDPQVLVPAIR